ncbi:MAG TPA: DUF2442 domain-containing protein [Desulfobacter sp.]|nr:DUF2442 domain-containing protein [Desulfobacter sp.]
MCANAITAKNRTSFVEPPITPCMPWRIQQLKVLPDYRLFVRFLDGVEGYVNMKQFLFSDRAGIFSKLRDLETFSRATLVYGAVTWPEELDLAPDAMYEEIKASGQWNLDG